MVLSNNVWTDVIVDDKDSNLCHEDCHFKDSGYCWLWQEKLENTDGICKRDWCRREAFNYSSLRS